MHAISSYRDNRPAHTPTHKQTGPITIHCAAKKYDRQHVVLEAYHEVVFSDYLSHFTALVWQQLEQYMISVTENLVKQFVHSFIHQR